MPEKQIKPLLIEIQNSAVKFISENINQRKTVNIVTRIIELGSVEWFPFCRTAQSVGWSTHRKCYFCFLTGLFFLMIWGISEIWLSLQAELQLRLQLEEGPLIALWLGEGNFQEPGFRWKVVYLELFGLCPVPEQCP